MRSLIQVLSSKPEGALAGGDEGQRKRRFRPAGYDSRWLHKLLRQQGRWRQCRPRAAGKA